MMGVDGNMRLYINTKKMSFIEENNEIEHEIILNATEIKIYGYDYMFELSDNDKFVKDTLKIIYKKDDKGNNTEEIEGKLFIISEQKTWWSFPLYEIVDDKIISFNYAKYQYFADTDRRVILGWKICNLYNIPSELKLLRKTFKYIMDNLNIEYPDFFKKYNDKIEKIINKNPK